VTVACSRLKQLRLLTGTRRRLLQMLAAAVTHAHIDHSGTCLLARMGFRGRVYCSSATRDRRICCPTAHLLEEGAPRTGTAFEACPGAAALHRRRQAAAPPHPVDMNREQKLADGMAITLVPNGHILGSAVVIRCDGRHRLPVTWDARDAVMKAPEAIHEADALVIESTYGDRLHETVDAQACRARIWRTARGGTVIIPSFRRRRAQTVLYYLSRLKAAGAIPDPALNSVRGGGRHRHLPRACRGTPPPWPSTRHCAASSRQQRCGVAQPRRQPPPKVIVSASGMATGGRVLHHLKTYAPDARNTVPSSATRRWARAALRCRGAGGQMRASTSR
jgi:metallo-beta-lactamase family protein